MNFCRSDRGKVRKKNEDSVFSDGELGLHLVADGVGGHPAGDEASKICVDAIAKSIKLLSFNETGDSENLVAAIRDANDAIIKEGLGTPEKFGMATTVVALFLDGNKATYAHVGDSRLYRYRDGAFEQMTKDHSVLNEELSKRSMTPEEIANFPYKHRMTRAVGTNRNLEIDCAEEKLSVGDIFLLCTDGLTNMLDDNDIKQAIVTNKGNIAATGEYLVDEANRRGGKDNITIVLVNGK